MNAEAITTRVKVVPESGHINILSIFDQSSLYVTGQFLLRIK